MKIYEIKDEKALAESNAEMRKKAAKIIKKVDAEQRNAAKRIYLLRLLKTE